MSGCPPHCPSGTSLNDTTDMLSFPRSLKLCSAAEASEQTAYNDGTNFNMQLPYGDGTWTITFWNDEACESQQIGGSVTVEINKN